MNYGSPPLFSLLKVNMEEMGDSIEIRQHEEPTVDVPCGQSWLCVP